MIVDLTTAKEEQWEMNVYSCPNCLNSYILDVFMFCPICGIKIEWIEAKETIA